MGYKLLEAVSSKQNLVAIDNSIIVRWLVGDGSDTDREIANLILNAISLKEICPIVPSLWIYEASNVIASYVKRTQIEESIGLKRLMMPFEACNIIEFKPSLELLTLTAIKYKLSSYDATYLYLAETLNCPLATLDKKLGKAVIKSNGQLFKLK